MDKHVFLITGVNGEIGHSLIAYLRPIAGKAGDGITREILEIRSTNWMQDGQQLPVPENVLGWLRLHERALIRLSSPEEYALAVEDAIYICQFIACMKDYLKGSESPLGERDFYMTENVDRLLRKLQRRLIRYFRFHLSREY